MLRTFPNTKTVETGIESTQPVGILACITQLPPDVTFDPNNPDHVGKLFFVNGEINLNEPGDMNSGSRSSNLLSKMLTGKPQDRTLDVRALENNTQKYLASGKTYPIADEKDLAEVNNIINNNLAYTVKEQIVENKDRAENPLKAKTVTAAGGGQLINFVNSSVTGGGGIYNINYQYCLAHISPCGMGDVITRVNGVEVIYWVRTSSDYATNPYGSCLMPGYGNAPSFNGIDLRNGKKFTITFHTPGANPQGLSEGCPSQIGLTCTYWEENGVVKSDCDTSMPPPPPVNCYDCTTWAGPNCPFEEPVITKDEECAFGVCEATGFQIAENSCSKSCGLNIFCRIACGFAREYYVFLAPTAIGNYTSYAKSMKYTDIFKMPNKTEQFYDNEPSQEKVALKVEFYKGDGSDAETEVAILGSDTAVADMKYEDNWEPKRIVLLPANEIIKSYRKAS
jgi:hypothetical protein